MKQALVIQTAFIGDAILATAVLERLHQSDPAMAVDILVRKGNESLFKAHPFIRKVWIWDKRKEKYRGLMRLAREIRQSKFDYVINLQRFFATGLLTAVSGATETIGFDKNPWSFSFSRKIKHLIAPAGETIHEMERNLALVDFLPGHASAPMRLYPSAADFEVAQSYALNKPYICIAPTSVWFTKQLPAAKWVDAINEVRGDMQVFLLGGPSDLEACAAIARASSHPQVTNTAGKLSLLQSAALIAGATRTWTLDSAAMHLASAMNAPVTAVFCSTIPAFGFGPRSDDQRVVETREALTCRPCGLHGKITCPQGHFRCAEIAELDILEGT